MNNDAPRPSRPAEPLNVVEQKQPAHDLPWPLSSRPELSPEGRANITEKVYRMSRHDS